MHMLDGAREPPSSWCTDVFNFARSPLPVAISNLQEPAIRQIGEHFFVRSYRLSLLYSENSGGLWLGLLVLHI